MTDAQEVRLHGQDIGEIVRFNSGRIQFEFSPAYVARRERPTLSQSFLDDRGDIVDGGPATTSGELPPFFSNLLPEGHLRTYLADKAGVRPTREFELLEVVGRDLPGAAVVGREGSVIDDDREADDDQPDSTISPELLRFSLAGVQLKLSAVAEASGGLTVPAHGVGGDWILKLPSVHYQGVPENEYSVMSLAIADMASVNPEFFVRTARETAERFQDIWEEAAKSLPMPDDVKRAIRRQLATVPAVSGAR